ncbi:hypothetical protein SNE40_021770 [Patella caerulea]|uniref:Uncharacterized protein n=1 Tax=Patella caerulea TaxID=87958 RepID=A0AAN8G079_PATCE
MLKVGIGE